MRENRITGGWIIKNVIFEKYKKNSSKLVKIIFQISFFSLNMPEYFALILKNENGSVQK